MIDSRTTEPAEWQDFSLEQRLYLGRHRTIWEILTGKKVLALTPVRVFFRFRAKVGSDVIMSGVAVEPQYGDVV